MLISGKSLVILAKEIGYRTSSPTMSKLRMKVGRRRAISKTKRGKMNIIRNQPESSIKYLHRLKDGGAWPKSYMMSVLLSCLKGKRRVQHLSYLSVHVLWIPPYFTRTKGWLNLYKNLIMSHLIVIWNMFCFRSNTLPIWRGRKTL